MPASQSSRAFTGPWPALEIVFHGKGWRVAEQRHVVGGEVRDEDRQRRRHRDAGLRDLLNGGLVFLETSDVRRVHEHRRAGVDSRERVDHRYGVGDRRQVVLLSFVDDQPQRRDFGSARCRRDQGLDVVEAGLCRGVDRLDGVRRRGWRPAGSVGRSGGRELSKRAGSPRRCGSAPGPPPAAGRARAESAAPQRSAVL